MRLIGTCVRVELQCAAGGLTGAPLEGCGDRAQSDQQAEGDPPPSAVPGGGLYGAEYNDNMCVRVELYIHLTVLLRGHGDD
eukprot:7735422-Pyramimonas_sp.AAC.1